MPTVSSPGAWKNDQRLFHGGDLLRQVLLVQILKELRLDLELAPGQRDFGFALGSDLV